MQVFVNVLFADIGTESCAKIGLTYSCFSVNSWTNCHGHDNLADPGSYVWSGQVNNSKRGREGEREKGRKGKKEGDM